MTAVVVLLGALMAIARSSAQYAPSGYRPPGRQFELPQRTSAGLLVQRQLAPPSSQNAPPLPGNLYLPSVQSADANYNFQQQSNEAQPATSERGNFDGQFSAAPAPQAPNSFYGFTVASSQNFDQQNTEQENPKNYYGGGGGQTIRQDQFFNGFSNQQTPATQYGPAKFNQQHSNQRFQKQQTPGAVRDDQDQVDVNGRRTTQEGRGQEQSPKTPVGFGAVDQRNSNRQEDDQTKFGFSSRQRSQYELNRGEEQQQGTNFQGRFNPERDEQATNNRAGYLAPAKNQKSNAKLANQNYVPPNDRRKSPEATTRTPETAEAEPFDEYPNVAVATAVARGQYYLLQPDGQLQRVIYRTQEEENNAYTAKLLYQNVEPIVDPIYSYSQPLIRLN